MSKNVEFHSYSVNVKTALKDKAIAFLHEIGGEIRSQAQRNSRRTVGIITSVILTIG